MGERGWMSEMGIQRRDEGGSFLDDAHPGMGMSVDASFVSFGGTEESFEIEVVSGQDGIVFSHEKSGIEAQHRLGHMLSDGVFVRLEGLLKGEEGCFTLVG